MKNFMEGLATDRINYYMNIIKNNEIIINYMEKNNLTTWCDLTIKDLKEKNKKLLAKCGVNNEI